MLLVRDDGGTLRAFANICRNRGHELLACGATTNRGVIQCPYHAWTYALDGSLRLAPRAGDMANLDQAQLADQAGNSEYGQYLLRVLKDAGAN